GCDLEAEGAAVQVDDVRPVRRAVARHDLVNAHFLDHAFADPEAGMQARGRAVVLPKARPSEPGMQVFGRRERLLARVLQDEGDDMALQARHDATPDSAERRKAPPSERVKRLQAPAPCRALLA